MRSDKPSLWAVIVAVTVAALGVALVLVACQPTPAAPPAPSGPVCREDLALDSDIRVLELTEGPKGTLWVATGGTEGAGVVHYDGTAWCYYTKTHGLPDNRVAALAVDDQGGVWAGTVRGLAYLSPDASLWSPCPGLVEPGVSALLLEDDTLWVGTLRGLERWQDGSPSERYGAERLGSCWTLARHEEWLWVGTGGKGLHALRPDDGTWLPPLTRSEGLPSNKVRALYPADDGVLWVGTEGGLAQVEGERVTGVYTATHGLTTTVVTALAGDGAGGLWLGTPLGQFHFDPTSGRVDDRPTDQVSVEALLLDQERTLWASGWGWVVSEPQPAWTTMDWKATALAGSSDQLWVGTADGNVLAGPVYAQDANDFELVVRDDSTQGAIAEGAIYALLPRSANEIWAGTGHGAVHIVGGRMDGDPIPLPNPDRPEVWALADDGAGGLWLGGPGGLAHFDGTAVDRAYSKTDGLASRMVYALATDGIDGNGQLWVGTKRGLFAADPPWDVLQPVTMTGSLARESVYALHRVGNVLWVGTAKGIGQFTEEREWVQPVGGIGTNKKIMDIGSTGDTNDHRMWFRTDEGLLILDASVPCVSEDYGIEYVTTVWEQHSAGNSTTEALWPVGKNRVWMTTQRGLAYHLLSPYPPAIRTWLQVGGEDRFRLTEPLGFRQTDVLVQLRGGDLGDNTPGVAYRYQLTGFEDGWHATIKNQLPFTLTPGSKYSFRVVTFDGDLNPSPLKDMVLEVEAEPFTEWFFKEPWVRVLLVLLAVATIITAILWIVAQIIQYLRLEKYADFALKATRVSADKLRVTVHAGRHRILEEDTLKLPWEEIAELVKQVAAEQYDQPLLEDLGQKLGNGLLPPVLRSELVRIQSDKRLARLRLDFAADRELAHLPWELVFDPRELDFLGQQADTALVRYVNVKPGKKWKRPPIGSKLRVLVVMAQPRDEEHLDLKGEKDRLDKILAKNKRVKLKYLYGVYAAKLVGEEPRDRNKDLSEQLKNLLAEGWDVLHFVGHAGPDRHREIAEEVVLGFEDRGGNYIAVGSADLKKILSEELARKDKLPKLIVLSACETANSESELVQTILESGVGAVVGMQWPVLDVAAQRFADGFYRTLLDNGQADYAVSVARNRVSSKVGTGRRDWAAPVLIMQTHDGIIFKRTWYDILLDITRRR